MTGTVDEKWCGGVGRWCQDRNGDGHPHAEGGRSSEQMSASITQLASLLSGSTTATADDNSHSCACST